MMLSDGIWAHLMLYDLCLVIEGQGEGEGVCGGGPGQHAVCSSLCEIQ